MELRTIVGSNVDLITPFPISEVKRLYGWLHCYRTLTECDDSPKGADETCVYLTALLQKGVSWGVIDKNHLTNIKHEAPLVGFGLFIPSIMANGTVRSGELHVATARRAWKARLIDEAAQLAIKDVFDGLPSLLRLSTYMSERNAPAKALVRRLGFKFEGVCEDAILYENSPQNLVLYGLTRRNYTSLCQPKCSVESVAVSEEPLALSLDKPPLPPQEQLTPTL